jgi:hypothetical protein
MVNIVRPTIVKLTDFSNKFHLKPFTMKVKKIRVHYLIKGVEHQFDFRIWSLINRITVEESANSKISKAHPDVNWSDISDISTEEIKVW